MKQVNAMPSQNKGAEHVMALQGTLNNILTRILEKCTPQETEYAKKHAGEWLLVATVSGFKSRSRACRFERHVKKKAHGWSKGFLPIENRFLKVLRTTKHFRDQLDEKNIMFNCFDESLLRPKLQTPQQP